jgi:hypothetical protein
VDLSTSNSKTRVSEIRWRPIIRGAVALLILFLIVFEDLHRVRGYVPNAPDDKQAWFINRDKLHRNSDRAIVFFGASRMHQAINVRTAVDSSSHNAVQLAIEGSSSLPVLLYLSSDPHFRGTVVFSIPPAFTFDAKLDTYEKSPGHIWSA